VREAPEVAVQQEVPADMKIFILLLSVFFTSCKNIPENDNLVLTNAHVITMDPRQPYAETVVISNNKIIFVGKQSQSRSFISDKSSVIDLQGKTLIPGFIEGHAHLWNLGRFLVNIDLSGIKNWDEAILLVKEAVQNAKPGQWILCRGWHQEKWQSIPTDAVNGYPTHKQLSAAAPDNPVRLKHASGHALLVNQKAMELAGIDQNTANPEGGIILKDSSGQPTGILLEDAMDLVNQVYNSDINALSKTDKENYYKKQVDEATSYCLKNGITTFHDAGSSFQEIDILKDMAEKNQLPLRMWVMISEEEELNDTLLQKYKMIGGANNFLTVRAIKQYVDGALGTRGAWLLQPYSDMPATSGINVTPLSHIEHTAQLAFKNGYQLCTHAIGDRGNRETLDIYEKALQGQKDRRWRIEHAQHLSLPDIPRFAQLGVIASFQTVHCISDGPWVSKRIGEKRAQEGAYVWQKVLQSGGHLANGTDAPVESINVIENYYAAVTRKLNDGSQFYPQQILSREQALASLTIWNAWAAFEEELKGSIETGKLADLVVLSQDLLTVPEDQIPDTKVDMTILDGKVVYKR
jgi:predicted amidohydrolase YtcJ